MPRAKAILQSDHPYHINARCINKDWFTLPMTDVWEIFSDELSSVSKDKNLQIHSFVLMSNHFHLISSTPDANISQCMLQFMTRTSRRLTRAGNRINETFAGRHYKCILHRWDYYLNAYKYCYRNPVEAGICERVEEYPFSTLSEKLSLTKVRIPVLEDTMLVANLQSTLSWLNSQPNADQIDAVRFGLRRPYFRCKKIRNTNKPVLPENDIL